MKTKVIHNIRYILNLTFTARLWFVIFVPILSIVIAQRDVAMAWLSAQIFNNLQTALFEDHDLKYLRSVIFCAILMFLVFIGEWLLSAISDMIENYWREAVNLKLRKRFMKRIMRWMSLILTIRISRRADQWLKMSIRFLKSNQL